MKRSNPAIARRRATRAVAVALLSLLCTFLWSPNASAETTTIELVKDFQAWFWTSNREVRQCVGTEGTGVCQVVDGSAAAPVEPGHLGVAVQNGAADMRSYIRFDLLTIPPGSLVRNFVVTLPISLADASDPEHTQHHTGPGAKAPATSNPDQALINACAVMIPWGDAEAAPPYTMDKKDPTKTHPVEPFVREGGVDCGAFTVAGKRGAKAWTFDLTKIAQQWVAGTLDNNGVALLPVLPQGQTAGVTSWRVEFHGASFIVQNNDQEQTYVGPKEVGFVKTTFIAPSEPPPPPPPPPPDTGGGFVPTTPPTIIAPDPAPTSDGQPTPVPTQPPAEPVAETTTGSAAYVWLVVPIGIAAFSAFTRAIGREAGAAGMNRVAEVLRRRRASAVTGD